MDLRLHDSTRVFIRPIRPEDKALLVRGMAELSPRSARLRFMGPKNRLTLAELRYLTEIDQVDHYGLVVAVFHDDPRRLAGVGRWVRDAENRDAAEVAVVVGDCLQGRGPGDARSARRSPTPRAPAGSRASPPSCCPRTPPRSACSRTSRGACRRACRAGTYELVADLAA